MNPEPVRVTEADVDRVATQIGLVIATERRAAVAQHLAPKPCAAGTGRSRLR